MNRIARTGMVVMAGALVLLSSSVFAQPSEEERAQAVADTRQGLFKVIGSYFGPVVGMARGQIPYDGDRVVHSAQKIEALAAMIPDVLRTDTRAFDLETGALDGIWENPDDVAGKVADLEAAAAALATAAGESQEAAMAAFRKTGGACKACHDEYRQKD